MQPEWAVPQSIMSKFGTLLLNHTDSSSGRRYQVQPDGFRVVPTLRVTQDNLSQSDGSVLHPRWTSGAVAMMSIEYVIATDLSPADQTIPGDINPACDEDLLAMDDQLLLYINAMRTLTYADNQRYLWTGSDGNGRMLIDVELLAWSEPTFNDTALPTTVTLALETPFPYAIDQTQTTTSISDGATDSLLNNGTADFYPVIKAYGPFTSFSIANTTTGLQLDYDDTRPGAVSVGGGDYAEIDFFRGTVFLNGDSSDLIAGIVPSTSDFWTLACDPAIGNIIAPTGCDIDILWNRAWA